MPDVKDSSAIITWKPPRGLVQDVDIVGYIVTLYDANKVLNTKRTRIPRLEFTKLNQYSKYYVTVQVEFKNGLGEPSSRLVIQTKGGFLNQVIKYFRKCVLILTLPMLNQCKP